MIATAILVWLLHHALTLNIGGNSYHQGKLKAASSDRKRLEGRQGEEFSIPQLGKNWASLDAC